MDQNITKISETEYTKEIEQAPIVETRTIAQVKEEIADIEKGIINNQNQIVFLESAKLKLQKELAEAIAKGVIENVDEPVEEPTEE